MLRIQLALYGRLPSNATTTLYSARPPRRNLFASIRQSQRSFLHNNRFHSRHGNGQQQQKQRDWSWWWSAFRAGPRQRHGNASWRPKAGWLLVATVPGLHVSGLHVSTTSFTSIAPPSHRSIPATATVFLAAAPLEVADQRTTSTGVFSIPRRVLAATWSAIRVSWRFLQLAVLFGPVILTFPIWYLTERKSFKLGTTPNLWWVEYLVWSFEISGPTFTKLGQWASSRSDLFPAYVCEILGRLQSHVSPHSFSATKRIIKREYGVALEEMFEEFNEKPIGVGAIAQVYKAKLRPTAPGASDSPTLTCAVKVLHPGVEWLINADLKIMHFVASVINLLPDAQWLSFPDEVAMFGQMMHEQLDLRCEAENLNRFTENFRNRPKVSFPSPYMALARRTVLIERFAHAIPIRKFLDEGHTPFDHAMAEIGLDSFLRMLVLDNFVHADLHPGNIFITFDRPSTSSQLSSLFGKSNDIGAEPNSISPEEVSHLASLPSAEWHVAMNDLFKKGYTPRFIFLDAGLVSTLSTLNLRNFLDLFRAVAEFDGERVGHLMIERSRTPQTVINQKEFVDTMAEFLNTVKYNTLKLGSIKVGDILAKVFSMVRTHHIKIEGDFANVGVSIVLLEGIGRRLDPDIDLLHEALPILRDAAKMDRGGVYEEPSLRHLSEGKTYYMLMAYRFAKPISHNNIILTPHT
ncbi:ABC1 family-domain-containing protein [Fimicolochytrium jonesii]|uniref:ABC1 family-domain-containing protein n=1 Tax=Fimicolochytrium jonesii TaxID=1396493 RepID=UPI0022FEB581|nr:ABC1 family-domain-containing protein [Fimicolochytrium jonesii]KAI8824406.1 ABC1 family-domain-containing protein [Fimicolochytrium jonesii]